MSSNSKSPSVLIVKIEPKIGDVFISLPFLYFVCNKFNNRFVFYVCSDTAADLLKSFNLPPNLVVVKIGNFTNLFGYARVIFRIFSFIITRKFEVVYFPSVDLSILLSIVFTIFLRTPVIYFNQRGLRGFFRNPFAFAFGYSYILPIGEGCAPFLFFFGYEKSFSIYSKYKSIASSNFKIRTVSTPQPFIIISPSAAEEKRKWPLDNYYQLCDCILSKTQFRIVFLQANKIFPPKTLEEADRLSFLNVSIHQVMQLIHQCDLFVGNDSGLAHIAALFNKPCVVVSCHPIGGDPFHANSPTRFSPATDLKYVLQPTKPLDVSCATHCVSRDSHCIREINVNDVVSCVFKLIA